MSDVRDAEGNQGNAGFASEWQRLAREDDGQGSPPQDSDALLDGQNEQPDGQSSDAPPSEVAAPQEPAAGEATSDIWADAPEPLRKAYEAERIAREKAENAARTNGGRASRAEREAAELRARTLAQPTPAPAAREARKPNERLAAVAEEYSEVAGPLVEEVTELRALVESLLDQGASQQEVQRARDELELTEHLNRQEALLLEEHSDWAEVVLEPAFVEWVNSPTTPQMVRDGISRNGNGIVDAGESATILNMFKDASGRSSPDQLAARRARQLEGSRAVPARTIGATPAEAPDDFHATWAALREKERREAQRR